MASLLNWFRGGPAQPARIPTDTVIPLHYVDSTGIFTKIVMDLSFQFDRVLDERKLVGALEQLLAKPGWRKLGARIRRNVRSAVTLPIDCDPCALQLVARHGSMVEVARVLAVEWFEEMGSLGRTMTRNELIG